MEIHHHPHNPRKNWTHYLWDFIMLFLAVFCGFLAENKREQMAEHHRAKQYAQRLVEDLQNDITDIRRAGLSEDKTSLFIDSLVQFIKKPGMNKTGTLYYYTRFAFWIYSVDWSRSTLNQLISSGNLRYFANDELVNKISTYYTLSNAIGLNEENIDKNRQRAIGLRDQLLKAEYFQKLLDMNMDGLLSGNYVAAIDSLRQIDLPLEKKDPGMLNNMTNALLITISNRKQQKKWFYPKAIQLAKEVIALLIKEYRLSEKSPIEK